MCIRLSEDIEAYNEGAPDRGALDISMKIRFDMCISFYPQPFATKSFTN